MNATVGPRGSADTGIAFGPAEWGLSAFLALVWGSAFLLIAVAVDDLAPAVVPMGRVACGAAALALVPAARRRLPLSVLPRIVALGLLWMAFPFLLYAVAEQTTASAVAGMLNGTLPVTTVAVTAVFLRQWPSRTRILAVVIAFAGVLAISANSIGRSGTADLRGILLLLTAIVCFAVGANLVTPLQRTYGALPVILHIQVAALLWSLPSGLDGLRASDLTFRAVGSVVLLGAVGTGIAFGLYGMLIARTGPVRGMIGVFFTPVVATVLGVLVRDESIGGLEVLGMGAVILGAVMTSRPERRRATPAH